MNMRMMLAFGAGLLACCAAWAHQAETTIPEPGFRPEAPAEGEFLAQLGSARIAVLPTLVRRIERTAHSHASRAQIVEFLNGEGIGEAIADGRRIDRGGLERDSQWNIFQGSMAALAHSLARAEIDADYILLLEILVPGDEAVFGIECYIVTRSGESAFSFLLNEHHQAFAEAKLVAGDSQASRDALITGATVLALNSLAQNIARAQQAAGAD